MNISFAILASLLGGLALQTHADTTVSTRIVTVPVDLSTTKVVKTNHGYGSTYLVKILVPELAGPTLMNHRNAGETAPCLATYEAQQIDEVLQGKPETLLADMKIELTKSAAVSSTDSLCHIALTESITTTIRGFTFWHSRSAELPVRDPADCR